jgi:hypothetical protein
MYKNLADNFQRWALDPARTREERFSVELLNERFLNAWRQRHQLPVQYHHEADRLRRKERQLNPAHEPHYTAEEVARTAEVLDALTALSFSHDDDRPLRDLQFLRFLPGLKTLSLTSTQITDWQPITHLRALESLHVIDSEAVDLRPIGELTQLTDLSLFLFCPWPRLEGLERLVALETFSFHGNPLALAAIPAWPAVRSAKIKHVRDFKLPLRSLHDLPRMPELRKLELINTWRLDGIEHSPLLRQAEIYGYFNDLTPLAGLQQLTHLVLSGGDYPSLAPVAQLRELRWLKVRREEPQDFSVLAEAPRLHEVEIDLCPANKLEVATLNAALTPWSDEFGAFPPRPLAPLRLRVEDPNEKGDPPDDSPGRMPRDWSEDPAMGQSEARWFLRECHRRLTALLGKGWGKIDYKYVLHAGSDRFNVTRMEDIDRLPEIVECLRRMIARARYPWTFWVHVDNLARYERSLEDLEDEDDDAEEEEKEFDAEREREEWESRQRWRRERQAYLEREYRYRLQQQQGTPIRPEDFAPPKQGDEPELAQDDDRGPEYDLGTQLRLYAMITETSVFIQERDRPLAELLLEMKAEEPPEV